MQDGLDQPVSDCAFPLVTLNDNGLYEYLLHEDIFVGVAGIMECEGS